MKKTVFRVLSLMICAFVILASITGCGGEKPVKAQEDEEKKIEDVPTSEYDLKGETIRIAHWWDASPKDGSTVARYKAAEDKYNCKIEHITITWGQIVSKFTSSVLSGEPIADIVMFEMNRALPVFAESGLIIPVDEYFDFNDPKWPSVIKQTGRYDGKQYGFNNYSWDVSGIYYNKELIQKEGLTDPYLLQENGEWTWKEFLEIAQKATKDTDGDGENDQWGVSIQGYNLYSPLILSNGANIVNIDDNGKVTLTLDDPKVVEAIQFFGDLHNKYKVVVPVADVGDWYEAPRNFSKGNVAMFFGQSWDGEELRKAMEKEFGFVFMPKGPKASDYIVPIQNEAKIYVMPKHAKYPKEAAMIFEEISVFDNNIEGFRAWTRDYLYSESDFATAEKMLGKGKVTMYHGFPSFKDLFHNNIINKIVTDNVPAETFVENLKDQAQDAIDNEFK